jgi:hypothetical protein
MSKDINEKEVITISTDLAVYDSKQAQLEEFKKYSAYEIDGIKDTKGYIKVQHARKLVKSARTNVEVIRKSLKEKVLKCGKAIDTRAKKLTAELLAIENPLKEKEKAIDNEKAAIKEQKANEHRELIQGRVAALLNLGCNYVEGNYYYGDSHVYSVDIDAEEWKKVVVNVGEWRAAEDNRKAEEERIKKEAEDKAKVKRKIEREELERQRKEQEQIAKEQAEAQAEIDAQRKAAEKTQRKEQEAIDAENKRLADEKEEQCKETARLKKAELDRRFQLFRDFGMYPEGNKVSYKTYSIIWNDIAIADLNSFNDMLNKAKEIVIEMKAEEERIESERIKKAEDKAAAKAIKDAEDLAKKKEAEKTAKEKAEKEELERQERLKPDKEKLNVFTDKIEAMQIPVMYSEEGIELSNELHEMMSMFVTDMRAKIR